MITREFTLGDRLISVWADLYHPDETIVVLGGAETVAFRMVDSAGSVKVNNQAAVIESLGSAVTNEPARVRYDWAAADVDTAGEYTAWFIRQSGGQTEHFPPQDRTLGSEFIILIRPAT